MKTKVEIEATAKAGSTSVLLVISITGCSSSVDPIIIACCANKAGMTTIVEFGVTASSSNSKTGRMWVDRAEGDFDQKLKEFAEIISAANVEYLKMFPELKSTIEVIADVS